MLDSYTSFFIASSAASAAFLGLLFVSLTVANVTSTDHRARARRETLAGSAFLQLLDAFFVATTSLAGNLYIFAGVSVLMACIGLYGHSRLLPRAIRAGNWARGAPARVPNIVLPLESIAVYSSQLVLSASLFLAPSNPGLLRLAVLIDLGLYASALARAWEITRDLKS
jgi:hypothetical protein